MLSHDHLVDAPGGPRRARPSGSRRPARSAASRRRDVERHAAAEEEAGIVVAEHQVGVGDRRLRAAPAVAGRAGIGAGGMRADLAAGRPRRCAAIEPPPAPISIMSTDRRLDRQAGALLEAVHARRPPASARSAARPSSIRQAFAVVPPMSKAMTSGRPARAPNSAVASAPPAGPDSSSRIGKARAASGETRPPAECISRKAPAKPRSRSSRSQAVEVAVHQRLHIGVGAGRDAALVLADLGARPRDESETDDVGEALARRCAARRRSCAGLR